MYLFFVFFTLFLEPLEQALCMMNQASEAEPMLHVDTQSPESLVLRGLIEVFTVFL